MNLNPAHIHLLLNHIPILGTLFGIVLLASGLFFNNNTLRRSGLITFIVVALLAIPTYLSGGEAEEQIEDLPGVSEQFLEEHEEIAEGAVWLVYGVGAVSLLAIALLRFLGEKTGQILNSVALTGSLVSFGFMIAVGYYGGKIRHSELNGKPAAKEQVIKESQRQHMDDDDDDDH
jgi:hypothetical protein